MEMQSNRFDLGVFCLVAFFSSLQHHHHLLFAFCIFFHRTYKIIIHLHLHTLIIYNIFFSSFFDRNELTNVAWEINNIVDAIEKESDICDALINRSMERKNEEKK